MNFDRMRALLLEQAIQGKLLPQFDDEPPVEQIGEALENVPFETPEKWKWCYMKWITQKIHYGFTASAAKTGNAKLLRITDIQDGRVNWETVPFCDVPEKKLAICKLEENDVVIARTGGTIGKSFLLTDVNDVAVFASYLIRLIPSTEVVDPKYLMVFLNSPEYWKQLRAMSQGTGQPNVNAKSLSTLQIPLPPLKEQARIVAKLEESFAEIDRAEKAYQELQMLSGVLRGQILQEAIQGKLVPQLDSEEAVEQIGDAPEDVPFAIPEKWKWMKVSDLATAVSTGPFGSMLHKSDYVEDGIPVINPMNMVNGRIVPQQGMMVSAETADRLMSYQLKQGDIVIARRGDLGRCAVVQPEEEGWLCGTGSFFISLKEFVVPDFFAMCVGARYFVAHLNARSIGTTMANLNHRILKNSLIPVPPLREQSRILSKVTDLMNGVDTLSVR